ncbi:oligosaccharide flippase family protein [Azospirillum sp. sgz301742]
MLSVLRALLDATAVGRLLRGASGLFVANIAGAGLAFLLQLTLARVLGATSFGAYAYALAWLNILSYVAVLGHDMLLLRQVAAYRAAEDWSSLRGVLRHAQATPLLAAMAIAAVGAGIVQTIPTLSADLASAMTVGFLLLPLVTMLRVRGSILCAVEQPFLGLLPERLARDAVAMLLLLALVFGAGVALDAAEALVVLGCGTAVALAIVSGALRRWSAELPRDARAAYRIPEWLRAAAVMAAMGGLQMLLQRADLLMIGWLLDTTTAGVYAVATSLSEVCAFPMSAVASVFAPTVAALYARGDRPALQDTMTMTCRWSLVVTAAIAVPLAAVPELVLSLYGAPFVAGAGALRLLLAAQLLKAAVGAAALLMTMTGNETRAALILGIAAFGNLLLNLLFIPLFGIEGAALATVTASAGAQLFIARGAATRTGIHTGPFPVRPSS